MKKAYKQCPTCNGRGYVHKDYKKPAGTKERKPKRDIKQIITFIFVSAFVVLCVAILLIGGA